MCARPVWSESSLCAQWVAKEDPSFLMDSEDWSDWADAQADPSLCWVHMPFCWFCLAAAHLLKGKSACLTTCLPVFLFAYLGNINSTKASCIVLFTGKTGVVKHWRWHRPRIPSEWGSRETSCLRAYSAERSCQRKVNAFLILITECCTVSLHVWNDLTVLILHF